MLRSLLVVTLAVGFAPAPVPRRPPRERVPPALAPLQGTWRVVSYSHALVPAADHVGRKVVVSGARLSTYADGRLVSHYTLTPRPDVGPTAIDLGRTDDRTLFEGVFSLSGDRLEMTFPTSGGRSRPAKAGPGYAVTHEVLRRDDGP